MSRQGVLETLVSTVLSCSPDGIARVGINGVDGSGKSRLADDLAERLTGLGRPIIRSSIDYFHNPRAVRYRRGRHSAEGFYRDSFDLGRLTSLLLAPLSPGGNRRYKSGAFDHRTDSAIDVPERTAAETSILIFDGIFIFTPALIDFWNVKIFLDVPFAESFRRMALRDGSDPDPDAQSNRRYRQGQELYLSECRPREIADILVDYRDWREPTII